MPLNRDAVLARPLHSERREPLSPRTSAHLPVRCSPKSLAHGARLLGRLPLLVLALLGACAEAPDGSGLPEYQAIDSAVEATPDAGQLPEPGEILAPTPVTPYDAGQVAPGPVPGAGAGAADTGASKPVDAGAPSTGPAPTPVDAGTPSTPVDAGAPKPVDAGTPTPPMDSGAPAPVDAGPPKPVDAGSTTPDTGASSQMCAAAPSYSTKTACGACTCAKCAQPVKTCFASSDSAKNTLCASVQACAETNHCVGTACYCGTASCLLPNGPCKAIIDQAAGSETITAAGNNLESPVGRAKAIGACQETSCKSECGL